MKRIISWTIVFLGIGLLAAQSPGPLTLTWLGQSCFIIRSPGGTQILVDPFGKLVGYEVPSIKVDAVTVSHEHFDHNNVAMAQDKPVILRGLKDGDWGKIDQTVGDVHIRSVGVYHDDKNGAQRGKNAVMIFETGGKTIVHLGDLGHQLTPEQIKAIGRVDVLLIPVGGNYTIDAAGATRVVSALKPKIVIPMHYKTAKLKVDIAPLDAFLQGKPRVERIKGSILEIKDLPAETTIIVLEPKQ